MIIKTTSPSNGKTKIALLSGELTDPYDEIAWDAEIRVIILTSTGGNCGVGVLGGWNFRKPLGKR